MKSKPSTAFRLRHRPQVWKAYKRILQFARAKGLKEGDRLPVQPELRKILRLSSSTHGAAMDELLADGALIAKQKIGTILADTTALERIPFTIATAAIQIEIQANFAFQADLFVRTQAALSRAGSTCVTYHREGWAPASSISDFAGLTESIKHEDIDGILCLTAVNWADVRKSGVPVCHTHWWELAKCGVIVDQAALARDAIQLLISRGCRRLAAASNSERTSAVTRFWTAFDGGVREAGLTPIPGETLMLGSHSGHHMERDALEQARQLLQMPARERPDGLILTDDHFASHLAMFLREAGDYRPMMAVQTNRQHPRIFLLPIFAYEVDIQTLADGAVNLLLERVRNPAARERVEWISPKLVQQEASSSLQSIEK